MMMEQVSDDLSKTRSRWARPALVAFLITVAYNDLAVSAMKAGHHWFTIGGMVIATSAFTLNVGTICSKSTRAPARPLYGVFAFFSVAVAIFVGVAYL
jgi:hypothetical protein